MYKIAIIYAGATYESALNHIRIQELLGKIKSYWNRNAGISMRSM